MILNLGCGSQSFGDIKVDVCLVTKNKVSENVLPILNYVPMNNLIVERSKPLGYARMKAIERVKTEWFVFIDDDVYIGKKWFSQLIKHIKNGVGAVQGYPICVGSGVWDKIFNGRKPKKAFKLKVGQRGKTSNVLIKTSLVKDWKPSFPQLSSWEDYELTQHILKKGYDFVVTPIDAYHLRSMLKVWTSMVWSMRGLKKVFVLSPKNIGKKIMYHLFGGCVHVMKMFFKGDVNEGFYWFYVNLAKVKGLL